MTDNEEKIEKPYMKDENGIGLCANCINYKHCSYARRTTKPVLFCEEYDIYQELAEKYNLDLKIKEKS